MRGGGLRLLADVAAEVENVNQFFDEAYECFQYGCTRSGLIEIGPLTVQGTAGKKRTGFTLGTQKGGLLDPIFGLPYPTHPRSRVSADRKGP